MKPARKDSDDGPISEMAIVDTFTKLIFGEEAEFDVRELSVIEALRLADANVMLDDHRDMGDYLRALGVAEMVQLVARVRRQLAAGVPVASVDELLAGDLAVPNHD